MSIYKKNLKAEHLQSIIDLLSNASREPLSKPWNYLGNINIGAVYALGFERGSENLITITSDGQAVIDCKTGKKIYRNRENDGYDHEREKAIRLDKPERAAIDTCSIAGGSLRRVTKDGYSVNEYSTNGITYLYILQAPNSSLYDVKLGRAPKFEIVDEDFKAKFFGFSWSGRTLILVVDGDLEIWSR